MAGQGKRFGFIDSAPDKGPGMAGVDHDQDLASDVGKETEQGVRLKHRFCRTVRKEQMGRHPVRPVDTVCADIENGKIPVSGL